MRHLMPTETPNPLEPTAADASSHRAKGSAVAAHAANPRWPSRYLRPYRAFMRLHTFSFALVAVLILGCATEHRVAGRGDVGRFILQQAISYGGRPTTTNGLPAITSHWTYSQDADGLVISMARSDYSNAELFLSQAFAGQRHFGPQDGHDGFRIFECRLTPKGGGIQLSRNSADAQVIILRPFNQATAF